MPNLLRRLLPRLHQDADLPPAGAVRKIPHHQHHLNDLRQEAHPIARLVEPYLLLPLSKEEACHLYLTIVEKGEMLEDLATTTRDPLTEVTFIGLNEGIRGKLEPQIMLLGIEESGRHPARGPKRAPAGR